MHKYNSPLCQMSRVLQLLVDFPLSDRARERKLLSGLNAPRPVLCPALNRVQKDSLCEENFPSELHP
ncbi:hypothetical protein KUCAC02_029418, partial [Chaenocephalus aceratus]